jgi:hypothetical protein
VRWPIGRYRFIGSCSKAFYGQQHEVDHYLLESDLRARTMYGYTRRAASSLLGFRSLWNNVQLPYKLKYQGKNYL